MTTYVRTEVVEAERWRQTGPWPGEGMSAEEITEWINNHDGRANYKAATEFVGPRIYVIAEAGMGSRLAIVRPGEWVVIDRWLCDCGTYHRVTCKQVRACRVVPESEWNEQEWEEEE